MKITAPILTNSVPERHLVAAAHDLCQGLLLNKMPGHGFILDFEGQQIDTTKPLEMHLVDHSISHGPHHPNGFVLKLAPGLVK